MRRQRKFAIIAAFVVLCLVWSSTWLAIKVGLRDLPPISFVAIRFLIAVGVLVTVSLGRVRLLTVDAAQHYVHGEASARKTAGGCSR